MLTINRARGKGARVAYSGSSDDPLSRLAFVCVPSTILAIRCGRRDERARALAELAALARVLEAEAAGAIVRAARSFDPRVYRSANETVKAFKVLVEALDSEAVLS